MVDLVIVQNLGMSKSNNIYRTIMKSKMIKLEGKSPECNRVPLD